MESTIYFTITSQFVVSYITFGTTFDYLKRAQMGNAAFYMADQYN